MELTITSYTEDWAKRWDRFVLGEAVNGTFLQTRNFLSYHPAGRFQDRSQLVLKGTNIVAVIPACEGQEESKRAFVSHSGSTFGGIMMAKAFYDIEHVGAVVRALDGWLLGSGFEKVVLKQTSDLFSSKPTDLLSYFLFQRGYAHYAELSFAVDCRALAEDVTSVFASARRRGYHHAEKNGLAFIALSEDEQIERFFNILCGNLAKFGSRPVHTLDELLEFKHHRLSDIIRFYGVYAGDEMIAGSMVFLFGKRVFHTQYLAADPAFLQLYPMNFLNTELIKEAKALGFSWLSFGISTEERGRVLNEGLAKFKEGFGAVCINNETYFKDIKE